MLLELLLQLRRNVCSAYYYCMHLTNSRSKNVNNNNSNCKVHSHVFRVDLIVIGVCKCSRERQTKRIFCYAFFIHRWNVENRSKGLDRNIARLEKNKKRERAKKKSCISETNERWLSCPWMANVVRDKVERKKKWWNKNKCMDCAFLDSFKTLVDIVCAWSVFDGLFFCLYCCYSDYVIVRAFVYTMDFQFTVFVCSEHLL